MRPMVGLETDPQEVHGVLVTPVARTVIDLARSGSLVTAVAAADHALRHELCSPSELIAEVAAIPRRAAGRTSAALTRDLADPLSMSAGESLSRVQMFHLNLPKPILQRELHDGEGLIGLGDFWWEGVVGEFDGKVKYRIPAGATAEEASRILWAEKRREDRIRTRARMARWVWFDALRPDRLLQKLAHVGIRPVARPGWFDLGSSNAS